jgi:hypothetical protein
MLINGLLLNAAIEGITKKTSDKSTFIFGY